MSVTSLSYTIKKKKKKDKFMSQATKKMPAFKIIIFLNHKYLDLFWFVP